MTLTPPQSRTRYAHTHSETLDTVEGSKRRATALNVLISGRHLDNDIHTDKELRHFLLMYEEVVLGKLFAKGGYGAVYLASFRTKTVAMKQLLPDRATECSTTSWTASTWARRSPNRRS